MDGALRLSRADGLGLFSSAELLWRFLCAGHDPAPDGIGDTIRRGSLPGRRPAYD